MIWLIWLIGLFVLVIELDKGEEGKKIEDKISFVEEEIVLDLEDRDNYFE